MKYLFFILFAVFFGCSNDYYVEIHRKDGKCLQKEGEVVYYSCKEEVWGMDNTVALCDTKEECNKICEGYREKQK